MAPQHSSRGDSDPYLTPSLSVEVPLAKLAQELGCECTPREVTSALSELVRFGLTRYGASSHIQKEFSDSLGLSHEDPRRTEQGSIIRRDAWNTLAKSVALPPDSSFLLGASAWVDRESEIGEVLEALRAMRTEMAACIPIAHSVEAASYVAMIQVGDDLAKQPSVTAETRQTWQLARRQLLIASVVGASETQASQGEAHLISVCARQLEATRPSKSKRLDALIAELGIESKQPNSAPFIGDSLRWHYSTSLDSWAPQLEQTRYKNSSLFDLPSKALRATLRHYEGNPSSGRAGYTCVDAQAPKIELLQQLLELRIDKERNNLSLKRLYRAQCDALLTYLDARSKL